MITSTPKGLNVKRTEKKDGKENVLWQGRGQLNEVFLRVISQKKTVFEEWVYLVNHYQYFGALVGLQELPKIHILKGAGTPRETFILKRQ